MHEVTPAPLFNDQVTLQRPQAVSRLWLPKRSLSSCVFAAFSRSTSGVWLDDADRYSHFPSVPSCCLNWVLDGDLHMLTHPSKATAGSARFEMPDRFTFSGPFSQPRTVWNSGQAHVLVLMLLPDAFHALTGLDLSQYINQHVPARNVLDSSWQALSESVLSARGDDERIALIERFLDPLWARRRPADSIHGKWIKDWSHALTMKAATSGLGRSLRQAERRIKRWTGQPMREIRGVAKLELTLFDVLTAMEAGDVNWAAIAADSGYSDQAHLCRHIKQLTGFSPQELQEKVMHSESLWFYRLWSGIRYMPDLNR